MVQNFKVTLRSIGPDNVEGDHIICNSALKAWDAAQNLLDSYTFSVEGGQVIVKVDWQPMRDMYEEYNEFLWRTEQGIYTEEEVFAIFDQRGGVTWNRAIIDAQVVILPNQDSLKESRAGAYLSAFLLHAFLAMNLSAPGSFSLNRASYPVESRILDEETLIYFDEAFEFAWYQSLEAQWPHIGYIPLNQVCEWLGGLNLGIRQVATTRTETALFALLHACSSERALNSLMWLAHTLEALYDSPYVSISKVLKERIGLFLGVPDDKQNYLRKSLNALYEVRSAFVHGRMRVTHPLQDDLLDPDIVQANNNVPKAVDFAYLMSVATLQEMIRKNWKEIRFSETCFGIPL